VLVALASVTAVSGEPASISQVRLGTHAGFDRLVIELDRQAPVRRFGTSARGELEIVVAARPVPAHRVIRREYPRLVRVIVDAIPEGSRVRVRTRSYRTRLFQLANPTRIVLDVADPETEPFALPEDASAVLIEPEAAARAPIPKPTPPAPPPAERPPEPTPPPPSAPAVETEAPARRPAPVEPQEPTPTEPPAEAVAPPEPAPPAPPAEPNEPREPADVEPAPPAPTEVPEPNEPAEPVAVQPAPPTPTEVPEPNEPAVVEPAPPVAEPPPAPAPPDLGKLPPAPARPPAEPRPDWRFAWMWVALALLVGIATLWLLMRWRSATRVGEETLPVPLEPEEVAGPPYSISAREVLAARDRIDLLEVRLDEEARARLHVEERVSQVQEDLKVIRDRLNRLLRRPQDV
jgi:hypothetical protein